ncbi:hypothetical protein BSKO_06361 [Bryopsis sp. KO-2023]|nr:hypothetical protein BSKO_06361 [Bryopsis sp. KO-2023]
MNARKRRLDIQVELQQVRSSISQVKQRITADKESRGWLASGDAATVWRDIEKGLRKAMADIQTLQPKAGPSRQEPGPTETPQERDPGAQRLQEREREMSVLWKKCETIYRFIRNHKNASPFLEPVDVVKYNVPDYYDIIKRPMDVGTVGKKLGLGCGRRGVRMAYKSPLEFRDDMRQIWKNCREYNKEGEPVRIWGDSLCELWNRRWADSKIEERLKEIEEEYPLPQGDLGKRSQPVASAGSPPPKRLKPNMALGQKARGRRLTRPAGRAQDSAPGSLVARQRLQQPSNNKMVRSGPSVSAGKVQAPKPSLSSQRPGPRVPSSHQRQSAKSGARPVASAPPPRPVSKPSSASISDPDSPPPAPGVQYSQLVRLTNDLTEECGKYSKVEEVEDSYRSFLLRRKVSSLLEKLSGSGRPLDSVLEIVRRDPSVRDGGPVDLDALQDKTVKGIMEVLEKNPVPGSGSRGTPAGVQGDVDGKRMPARPVARKKAPGNNTSGVDAQKEGIRGPPPNRAFPASSQQQKQQQAGSRMPEALHRPAGDFPPKRNEGAAQRKMGQKRRFGGAQTVRQAPGEVVVTEPRRVAAKVMSEEEKRHEAARIIRESDERARREFKEKEMKRLREEREKIQRRADEKVRFLNVISQAVVRKVDLYEHETTDASFKAMGVTDELDSTKFEAVHRYDDTWANTDDESSAEEEEEDAKEKMPKIEKMQLEEKEKEEGEEEEDDDEKEEGEL